MHLNFKLEIEWQFLAAHPHELIVVSYCKVSEFILD